MQALVTFLNNPWVSSILSGLVVYLITNFFLSRKQNKEYSQKVQTANNELLYVMRPLVAQRQIPDQMIIVSLVASISRKYGINREDLLDLPLLADDLIREVMENPFLESDQKLEFCHKINELVRKDKDEIKTTERIVYLKNGISKNYVAVLLAFIASMTALSSSFISLTQNGATFEGLKLSTTLIFPLMIPLIALVTVTGILRIFMDKIERERYERLKTDFKRNLEKSYGGESEK